MPVVTARDTAPDLAASNLFYRRPDLYDQVQADPNHTVARQVEQVISERAPQALTLLDFGCGTGRDLEYLATRFDCTGVDVQPQMVAYARKIRPQLDVRVGDMRDFRLGRTVDVITCLGNSLAYIHEDEDLAAVFATFAAHAHPGTLLVISTLTEPVLAAPRTHLVETTDLRGEVTISYGWDEATRINTMRRVWRLEDGEVNEDWVRRRVMAVEEAGRQLVPSGFEIQLDYISSPGPIVAKLPPDGLANMANIEPLA